MNPACDVLPADTAMGAVMLKVADLSGMSSYYQTALGLDVLEEDSGGVGLGRGATVLIRLLPAADLRFPAAGEAGLFHAALLFDDRAALAATLASAARTASASRKPAGRYVGSADHLVSEAFYFADPEGNGIELYVDKPRSSWRWITDGSNRVVQMANHPLPAGQYLTDHLAEPVTSHQREQSARIGHVHLQVGDIARAQRFYVDVLGFERTAGWHDEALFVSAGGYHHHLAMNVWNSRGASPRRNTLGLGEVLVHVPVEAEVEALADRLRSAGVHRHHTGRELVFSDPWNNRIRVATR